MRKILEEEPLLLIFTANNLSQTHQATLLDTAPGHGTCHNAVHDDAKAIDIFFKPIKNHITIPFLQSWESDNGPY